MDILQKKGMCIPNVYSFCYSDVESVDHIFLHCPYATEVWSEIMAEVGLAWVFSQSFWDSFLSLKVRRFSTKGNSMWS